MGNQQEQTHNLRLFGRVALITGASSGIGAATALALAREGASVLLVARRRDRLEELVTNLRAEGLHASFICADITVDEDVKKIFEEVEQVHGRLDILINNAGIMLLSPVREANPDDWRKMIELNLFSLMFMTQSALPLMKHDGTGHIVNVASVAGRVANPGSSGYAATKFGVVGFSESLRREVYKDNIRVTVVESGIVATELVTHITNDAMKAGVQGRLDTTETLQPEDIAAAILYAVTQPARVNVNEILVRPTSQER
jgi:NADP-dependent 3-hydroxy acid dehydrogenase YdfG